MTLDLIPNGPGLQRLLIVGMGEESDVPSASEPHWLSIGGFVAEAMSSNRLRVIRLPDAASLGLEQFEMLVLGVLLHGFELSKRSTTSQVVARMLVVSETDRDIAHRAVQRAQAVNRARAWVEEPANLLTPPAWCEEARAVFCARGATVHILRPQELRQLGAGALLAVGRGSEHGAHLLVVESRGTPELARWDAVLVGKGLTFDGGGLNLKTPPNIARMKLDMGGGAAVLGALELAMLRKSRLNLAAIVPMAENAIDALAYRPGDVLTTLSGLTIEVADTDAEGRLVLADAIAYGIRSYRPTWLVDAATLTTLVTSVLHEEFAGLYSADERLARDLIDAGDLVGERLWRLPLVQCHDYLVESELADLRNTGAAGPFGKGTGSPTAGAKLLQRFADGTRWAHIDLAGTIWSTRRTAFSGKGATGYGVRLLDRWLASLEQA